jgi:predicted amidohydrolase
MGDSETRTVTLGAACMRVLHDKAANLRKIREFIGEAAAKGVELLVFPEMAVQGYLRNWRDAGYQSSIVLEQIDYYFAMGEQVPGPIVEMLAALARAHSMYIQLGMAEINQPRTIMHNSAILVGPEGLVGVFRKVHAAFERPLFRPGTGFPVFDTALGKVGPFICADLDYPESLRCIAIQGAIVATMSTAYPMASPEGDPETDYQTYLYRIEGVAQAAMNQVWVVQSNHIGQSDAPGATRYFGNSRIVSPWGKVVSECGYEEALVTATVDLAGEVHAARRRHNRLADRRPEVYGLLLTEAGFPQGKSVTLPAPSLGEPQPSTHSAGQ